MPHQLAAARTRPAKLGVIGNISRDLAVYPGGRTTGLLGGAALHVSLAAARAGLPAAPATVIGTDLAWIISDPRLAGLDLTAVTILPGTSPAFRLVYDDDGCVAGTGTSFGVAETTLTGHALSLLSSHGSWRWHVCCRRPLDAPSILSCLAAAGTPFSVDFHLASAAAIMPPTAAILGHAAAIFVNAAEFAILSRSADPGSLPLVVVSDGPRAASVLRHGKISVRAVPPPVTAAEVTGAGDVLAGTFLAEAARGASDEDALRAAVSAASEAVAGPGLVISQAGS